MAFGGGDISQLFSIDVDVSGITQISKLTNSFRSVSSEIDKMNAKLRKATKRQQAFQRATVGDIQTGRSVFGQRSGRIQATNNALREAQQMSLGANEGMRRYASATDTAGNKIQQFQGSQSALNKRLGQAQTVMAGFSSRAQTVSNKARGAASGMREHMQAARNMQTPMQKSSTMFSAIGESASNAGGSAKDAGGQFGKMFGIGMNLMFMGMALQQVFGRLAGSMLKTTGTTEVFGAAAKSTLLPFFIAIAPLLNKIAFFFMNLSKPIKMVLGAFVGLMAVMGTFLFFGAQVGILAASISASFLALSASLLVVVAGLAILSVGLAGLVMLFREGNRMIGALMIVVSALGAAFLALGLKALFAAGYLSSLAAALGTIKTTVLTVLGPVYSYAAGAVASAIASTKAWVVANSALLSQLGMILFTVGSLVLGLYLLNRVFKKFGPIVGLLATIIGGVLLAALTPIAAIVLAIFGAFKAVNMVFKKFGKIAGVIAAIVVGIVAVIVGVFVSLPVAIGLAIGAVLALIWNFKDEIVAAVKGVIKWIGNLPNWFGKKFRQAGNILGNWTDKAVGFFKDLWNKGKKWVGKLLDFILDLPSMMLNGLVNLSSALIELGESMVDGIVDGIKNVGSSIADTFFGFLPDVLATAVKGASRFAGGLVNRIQDVLTPNDFILTSGGKMIQPASNDTIVGFNGNGPIQPGGGGGNVTVNINDPVMKEDVDVQRVVDEVEDRVNRDTRGRTGGLGN